MALTEKGGSAKFFMEILGVRGRSPREILDFRGNIFDFRTFQILKNCLISRGAFGSRALTEKGGGQGPCQMFAVLNCSMYDTVSMYTIIKVCTIQ